jgi:hypothetical protein
MMEPGPTIGCPSEDTGASVRNGTANVFPDGSVTLPFLLRLPREHRDIIYEHYVRDQNGYIYEVDKDKLVQADGTHISLPLALTCQQIASELRGIALSINSITFSISLLQHNNEAAATFYATTNGLTNRKKTMLRRLAPQPLTREMIETAAET